MPYIIKDYINIFDLKLSKTGNNFFNTYYKDDYEFQDLYKAPSGFQNKGKTTFFLINCEIVLSILSGTVMLYAVLTIVVKLYLKKLNGGESTNRFMNWVMKHQ